MINIRTLKKSEWSEVSQIIFYATNTWYEKNGKSPVFVCAPNDLMFFCETYESIDPGCCLIAEIDNRIGACCFYHPKSTHYSLGIMCVHPDFFGKGLAKLLLNEIILKAQIAGLPIHLISSAQNIDSFSLYNKAGFIPVSIYQDMIISVPEDLFLIPESALLNVHKATESDIKEIVKLEYFLNGKDHSKDLQHIINSSSENWNCHIFKSNGKITGFLCSVNHPSSQIIGLGASKTSAEMDILIKSHLQYFKNLNVLVLVPSQDAFLKESLLKLKAKNIELHLTQVYSTKALPNVRGVILPTFLPE
ncbi:MAG: GNAT family N-acetyltransferase [Lentisphaerales bacterium]|nr:GNAT family N-acetyltransferase [Lentisphaerales bacterium]